MKNSNLIILLLIVCLGAFLRIYRLGDQSLWLDEARAFFRAGQNINSLWINQPKESNPPFYDALFHFYLQLTGRNDEFYVRFFSAIIGILLVPLIFFAGKCMFGAKAGLLSSFLIAISPYHIYYSQDAKMYALLAFLSLFSLFLYYLSLEKGNNFYWVSYTVTTIALIYSHNIGFLLFLAQIIIFVVLYRKIRGNLWNLFLSFLVIAISLVPRVLCWLWQISIDANPWLKPASINDIIQTFSYFSVLSWKIQISHLVSIALVICLPIYIFIFLNGIFARNEYKSSKEKNLNELDNLKFVLIYLFAPLAIALLISLKKPIYLAGRYDMCIFPAFCLVAGLGLAKIKKVTLIVFLLAGISISTVLCLHDYYYVFRKSNDRMIADYVQSNMNRDDTLIFTDLSSYTFRYYWKQDYIPSMISFPAVDYGWLPRAALVCNDAYTDNEIMKIKGRIKEIRKKDNRIWLMFDDMLINRRLVEALKKDYQLESTINFVPGRNTNQVTEVLIFKSRL